MLRGWFDTSNLRFFVIRSILCMCFDADATVLSKQKSISKVSRFLFCVSRYIEDITNITKTKLFNNKIHEIVRVKIFRAYRFFFSNEQPNLLFKEKKKLCIVLQKRKKKKSMKKKNRKCRWFGQTIILINEPEKRRNIINDWKK